MKRFVICLSFVFTLCCIHSIAQNPMGLYPFTAERLITAEDITGKSQFDLKIMRNEIFARHGHTFKGEDLKKYFGDQAWYKPTVPDATSLLSDIEKKNIDLIRGWENKIAARGDFNTFYASFKKYVNDEDSDKLAEWISPQGMFDSADQFKDSFMRNRAEIQNATNKAPKGDETTRKLFFGEFYNGVQYQWVEFHKEGCCWVIFAIGRAG